MQRLFLPVHSLLGNQKILIDGENTYVIRGEPDFTILHLVNCIMSGDDMNKIKGISFWQNGHIVHNEPAEVIDNLDILPIPNRRLLDHSVYCNPKLTQLPHTAILTSRGCYGKCSYCVPNSLSFAREIESKRYFFHKPVPKLHSIERVIKEFTQIAELGFKSVSIIDDEFLWNEERDIEICNGIKKLNLEWSCLARPDKITERVAKSYGRSTLCICRYRC